MVHFHPHDSDCTSIRSFSCQALAKPVTLGADLSEFRIGSEVFSVGDMVAAFSALSQETLCGAVTAISQREVVVRTGGGARFSFLLSQLRNGRVTLSKDREAVQNLDAMRIALQQSAQPLS